MGRRGAGLVVLLLALSVAIILPNLTPRHIAGVAAVTPTPPPPVVGDCIVEAFVTDTSMTSTPTGWQPNYSHPTIGLCQGTVYGQIIEVITNPVLVNQQPNNSNSGQDTNYGKCPNRARHEGLPAGSDAGTAYGHWYVSLSADTVLTGPTPRQAAAGGHWIACVISISQNQTNQARGFDAPVSQWRRSRQVAEALGQCLLIASPSIEPSADCSITHAAESFGDTFGPLTPELITSCRALIGDLTGMADPTGGGRLHVEVLSYDTNGTQVTTQKQRTQTDTSQVCMVNGDHRSYLKGSLLALGALPVPFG